MAKNRTSPWEDDHAKSFVREVVKRVGKEAWEKYLTREVKEAILAKEALVIAARASLSPSAPDVTSLQAQSLWLQMIRVGLPSEED